MKIINYIASYLIATFYNKLNNIGERRLLLEWLRFHFRDYKQFETVVISLK